MRTRVKYRGDAIIIIMYYTVLMMLTTLKSRDLFNTVSLAPGYGDLQFSEVNKLGHRASWFWFFLIIYYSYSNEINRT